MQYLSFTIYKDKLRKLGYINARCWLVACEIRILG